MTCTPIKNGILCYSKIEFNCPHCKKLYNDAEEIYFNKMTKNKSGYTKIKCDCGEIFGVTSNFKGDLVGFELIKRRYNGIRNNDTRG